MTSGIRSNRMGAAAAAGAIAALCGAGLAEAQCTEGCTAIYDIAGESSGDQFGWVSENLGDLNGDGVNEFVLTATTTLGSTGRVYVYDGATGAERFRASGSSGAWLGFDAGPAGDVTGDGVPDVIAGAPGIGNGGPGEAFIWSGDASGVDPAPVWSGVGEAAGDQYGHNIAGGGDFDGDGVADFVVTAAEHDTAGAGAGRVYIYAGSDHALIATIDGFAAGDRFGSGVCFVEDVTGDGRDEVVVGAQNAGPTSGGLAYVFTWDGSSAALLHTLTPRADAVHFGQWFMNSAGDVDGDGAADIYISDYNANAAYVFSGATGDTIGVYGGTTTFSGGFGIGRMIPDVDGDGRADLLLAAWVNSSGAPFAGKAWVLSGPTGATLQTFTHTVERANFGFDANGMGDIDGDGRMDFLITAAADSSKRGRAYVLRGGVSAPCAQDLNDTNTVDGSDLGILLSLWGTDGSPVGADLNGDGDVDGADLGLLLAAWGVCS